MPSNSNPHIQLPETPNHSRDTWFEDLIDAIKADHFMLETNSASPEKKKFYDAMMAGDPFVSMLQVRMTSSQFFLKNVLLDYVQELKGIPREPHKLSLGFSDAQILVWAEIDDDDEEIEDLLLIAEAKMNAKYLPLGFYIKSTIVEKSYSLPVPPHYQSILA